MKQPKEEITELRAKIYQMEIDSKEAKKNEEERIERIKSLCSNEEQFTALFGIYTAYKGLCQFLNGKLYVAIKERIFELEKSL